MKDSLLHHNLAWQLFFYSPSCGYGCGTPFAPMPFYCINFLQLVWRKISLLNALGSPINIILIALRGPISAVFYLTTPPWQPCSHAARQPGNPTVLHHLRLFMAIIKLLGNILCVLVCKKESTDLLVIKNLCVGLEHGQGNSGWLLVVYEWLKTPTQTLVTIILCLFLRPQAPRVFWDVQWEKLR